MAKDEHMTAKILNLSEDQEKQLKDSQAKTKRSQEKHF